MERRKAITTAAAASLTLLAGAAGIALNSGIVSARGGDVGRISPVKSTSPPATVYVDDPTTAVTAAPPAPPAEGQPVATSGARSRHDDDRHDDDRHDDDRRERKYEGAEDDD